MDERTFQAMPFISRTDVHGDYPRVGLRDYPLTQGAYPYDPTGEIEVDEEDYEEESPGACEICEGCLDPRKFPNVTRGQTVCTACSEVLQRKALLR